MDTRSGMGLHSQRTLTMLVGVVALRYKHHTTTVWCGVDNGVPQLLQT